MPIRTFYVLLSFLCAFVATANAQQFISGPTGNFSVNQIRGCVPLTVTVNDLSDNPPNDPRVYNFNYNPGDRIPVNPTTILDTTYAIPGSYLIIQVVGSEIDSIRIEALEPRTPQFQLINCTNNRVFVDIQDNYYDQLEVDFGDGTIEMIPTTRPSFVHSYATTGEYPVTVQGLFNSGDNSGCADSTVQFSTFDGGSFPLATLTLVEVLDQQQIRVEYSLPDDNVTYQLQVAENGGNSSRSYQLAPGSTEIMVEQNEWDTRANYYCLTVSAIDRCSGDSFPSNALCTIALEGTAENLQNNLNWTSEPGLFEQYQVFRDGEQLVISEIETYEDTDVICQETYQYQVRSSDGVGVSLSETIALTAISTTVPTPVTGVVGGLRDLSITLEWPETSEAQTYYIYRALDGNSPVLYDSVSSTVPDLTYADTDVEVDDEYCYQLSYRDECGNESPLSNEVCLRVPDKAQVFFPNAFTPNGDGLNDVFLYKATLLESITFEVFNRWGELIFHTDQLDVGWDGTYNGVVAAQGTYLYKISVTDQLGNEFTQQGKVVLLN